MARSTRRKYYKRKVARWSPNIQEFSGNETVENGVFKFIDDIASNPTQEPILVSQVYTVKNVELTFTIDINNTTPSYIENLAAYIMYVPQGIEPTKDYNLQHPEYILAYKFIGSPAVDNAAIGQQYQPIRVRTRLARKLQTGDSIILFVKGTNQGTNSYLLEYHGLARFWTKAN